MMDDDGGDDDGDDDGGGAFLHSFHLYLIFPGAFA